MRNLLNLFVELKPAVIYFYLSLFPAGLQTPRIFSNIRFPYLALRHNARLDIYQVLFHFSQNKI